MKVVYMSDDGRTFDNKYDCMDCEWLFYHSNMKYFISFYDENLQELKNILSDDTYQNADTIIVTDAIVISDLHDLAEYTGFCNYKDITETGIWKFNMEKGHFVKTNAIET